MRRVAPARAHEWYNETYRSARRRERSASAVGRGRASTGKFMLDAAARERAKWGAKIPSNPEPASVPEPQAMRGRAGTTWVSLGPTKADYASNGELDAQRDRHRPRAQLRDPPERSERPLRRVFGRWRLEDDRRRHVVAVADRKPGQPVHGLAGRRSEQSEHALPRAWAIRSTAPASAS